MTATIHEKLTFLEGILGSSKYSNCTKEAIFFCPNESCGSRLKDKKKLYINLETDKVHCWVCEFKGNNLYNVLKIAKASVSDLKIYLSKFKSSKSYIAEEKHEHFDLTLPEEYIPLFLPNNSLAIQRAKNYLLNRRGITEHDILFHKIGYCVNGKYADRVILPSFDARGNINFFTARAINEGSYKYTLPDVPKNYKNSIILNELNVDFSQPVLIVEGFFDMLKCPQNTIPLFSSMITRESKLLREIIRNETSVYLGLDPDAQAKAWKIASMMISFGVDVSMVDVRPFEDIGAMTKEQVVDCIAKRQKIDEMELLYNQLGIS